jgi:dolichyl-phosphate beta-glucosyltransferase
MVYGTRVNTTILFVIPVFNEAKRWKESYFLQLASSMRVKADFLFVNDGSSDDSLDLVKAACEKSENFSFLTLDRNSGKAESIRQGFLFGISKGYSGVGFLDADGAFEAEDVIRIADLFVRKILEKGELQAIWSSRIALAGREIRRSKSRHLIGRVISKVIAGLSCPMPWDTQAGLKVFLVDDRFVSVTRDKFKTRWLFEVEIIQRHLRLFGNSIGIWEEPLDYWYDISGSKITVKQYLVISAEVLFIVYENFKLKLRVRRV